MSKNHQLNLSPNKIYTPKNMTNLNLNPSQYFSHKNKSEHILINSDRNSTEKREEILAQKKIFNTTFYEKDSKKTSFNSNKELPPINYKKSYERYKFASTFYKTDKNTVKTLKKRVRELHGEINKLRKEKNVKNYNILETNYRQKSKELTELKQENNYIKFQLEDLMRKNQENNKKIKDYKTKSNKPRSIKESKSNLLQQKMTEENKNDDYIKKNEFLKKKLELFKNELEKVNEENKELSFRLNEQTKSLGKQNEINKKNIELTQENENLKLRMEETKNKYEQELSKYKNENSGGFSMFDKKDKSKKDYHDLKSKYDDLQRKYELIQMTSTNKKDTNKSKDREKLINQITTSEQKI